MRTPLVLTALICCTLIEFALYPGHTYLKGQTQLFVPMLERLQYPGLLSRDLVATHPALRSTILDEATLSLLHLSSHWTLQQVLMAQHLASRLAAIAGLYLLSRRASTPPWSAACLTGLIGLGIWLPGLDLMTTGREAAPATLAFGYLLLAVGWTADEKILLGSLAGGIALLYSPVIAAPYWICALGGALLSRQHRSALRPVVTIGAVFTLLSANLAQLQPGAPQESGPLDRLTPAWIDGIIARVPAAWPARWMAHTGWLYLALTIASLCASYRLWPRLSLWLRPFALGLPLAGIFAWLAAALLAPILPFVFWTSWQPARFLLPALPLAALLFGAAALTAFPRQRWEALVWLIGLVTLLLTPAFAPRSPDLIAASSIDQLARWAEGNTWGGSLFVFPDAGRQPHPGQFRALAFRPVFVDWIGGELVTSSRDFEAEWTRRHRKVAIAPSVASLLTEPVDYVVLEQTHRLTGVNPVFVNADFAVYDARTLRNTPHFGEIRSPVR